MLDLPSHRVDVYFERWQTPELPASNDLSLLSDSELVRLEKFRRLEDRVSYARAHLLLRRAIHRYLPPSYSKLEFIVSDTGKPCLRPSEIPTPIEFNLTHCDTCVACAISNSPVGIDVESIQRDLEPETVNRILQQSEATRLKHIAPSQKHRALLKYWTCKESVLKAIGIGFLIEPHELVIEFSTARDTHIEILNSDYADIGPLQLFPDLLPGSPHVMTVASLAKEPKVITLIEFSSCQRFP